MVLLFYILKKLIIEYNVLTIETMCNPKDENRFYGWFYSSYFYGVKKIFKISL